MAALFAFFFLLVTVFTVIAMMLFGRQMDFPEGNPRQNFDTFPRAWMTIFQVTSGDTWMDVTWDSMRVTWVRVGATWVPVGATWGPHAWRMTASRQLQGLPLLLCIPPHAAPSQTACSSGCTVLHIHTMWYMCTQH